MTTAGEAPPYILAGHGLVVTTMGRGPDADPGSFALAGAAGKGQTDRAGQAGDARGRSCRLG